MLDKNILLLLFAFIITNTVLSVPHRFDIVPKKIAHQEFMYQKKIAFKRQNATRQCPVTPCKQNQKYQARPIYSKKFISA